MTIGSFALTPYVPTLQALLGFGGLLLTAFLCTALGALATGRRMLPEIQLVAGWGILSLVLTFWGMGSDLSMRIPLIVLTIIGLGSLIRFRAGPTQNLERLALLTLPLWLVVLPLLPSQIDTWLNLLPNAAYLADYGMFPASGRPDSYSFLPGAPYNTQFIAFAASVFSGSFAPTALSWFNILVCCLTGLLFARALAGTTEAPDRRVPWWALALGFLLAVPLNPGYTPRIFFASYGEAPLAVTSVFAVVLGTELLRQIGRRDTVIANTIALTLVFLAMVNTKQSGLGLVLAISGAILLAGWLALPGRRGKTLLLILTASLPSVALYLVWQWFVAKSQVEELTPLPVSDWNVALLPQILLGMLHAAWQKATFFIVQLGVFAALALECRKTGWVRTKLLLTVSTISIVLFNGFLIFTYIAHFPPDWAIRAHSYFRYSSQLSFVVMLALIVWGRDRLMPYFADISLKARHRWSAVLVATTLAVPLAAIHYLRFDLDPPQPALRDLVRSVGPYLHDGQKLALLLPGDSSDSVGSFLRGSILFTEPRHRRVDFTTETEASNAVLGRVAQQGYHYALITCTQPGMPGVEPGLSALLWFDDREWHTVTTWRPPADLGQRHFSAMLSRGPLCAEPAL